jgi:predicted HicB family RNase H-like nuclease
MRGDSGVSTPKSPQAIKLITVVIVSGTFKYKGYSGILEVDVDADILFGTVVDVNDVITFQGETIEEARQAFQDSVDDYLEWCEELGRDPEKPFSGKIHLRMNPEIHRKLFLVAKRDKTSINAWIEEVLERQVNQSLST